MQTFPIRNKIRPSLVAVALALVLAGSIVIAGCTSTAGPAPVSPPGTGNLTATTVKIADILKNPAAYNGTAVIVQGKITNECGSGCWFMLDDGTGTLYIDLAPNNFVIPQLRGTQVVATGTIGVANGDPTLFATKVDTGTRSYP
jgi:uncharacterized protein YdeI (BOF family)